MAPPGRFVSLKYRARVAHPLRAGMQWSLRGMEHADAEIIRRYQERRLCLLVRVAAARSPYYRDWFAGSGVEPASIRSMADLERLPLLTRPELAEGPERFRVYPRRLMWAATSSGTSGNVVTSYRTPGSSAFEMAALQRQWSWFGLPAHPRRVVLRGGDPDPQRRGDLTKRIPGSRQLVVSSFRLGRDSLQELLEQLRAFEPHAVEGWPSSLTLLAALLQERGQRLPVRAVLTSSEVMSSEQKALLRAAFDAPVVDHYGQSERVTMAGTCEAGGYHLFPEYGITELLPVEGTSDRWEIVGTPLHNWGFPLFRYRTGDEVGPPPDGPCPCGRAFPRVGAVHGRVEDAFTAADGRTLPLPSIVLDDLEGLREVQIAQLAPGRFEVRAVPMPSTDLTSVEAQVRRNVDRYYGSGQSVSFRVLSHIPRAASGKLRPAVLD